MEGANGGSEARLPGSRKKIRGVSGPKSQVPSRPPRLTRDAFLPCAFFLLTLGIEKEEEAGALRGSKLSQIAHPLALVLSSIQPSPPLQSCSGTYYSVGAGVRDEERLFGTPAANGATAHAACPKLKP